MNLSRRCIYELELHCDPLAISMLLDGLHSVASYGPLHDIEHGVCSNSIMMAHHGLGYRGRMWGVLDVLAAEYLCCWPWNEDDDDDALEYRFDDLSFPVDGYVEYEAGALWSNPKRLSYLHFCINALESYLE